ncbi:glucose 1-dehydrogenase [Chelatococcus composti]|jgi:gluconate 5-dehydrogenase|uniref:Gluconate 5-dehydrogenase n=1 Tax=Chelatococcus composti TaxID=1743235 RepID=A0A841K694_9HYPH|nr:glucose 1-dehydrogenase [Chelatococcus composti]MBB6167570.1 gluconate 5-dehydrogenase [Chelatococcus composti]MBS7735774.1 glucose 1-dehydrogenase [Chelatococcus composti]GGG32877.1 gluconate 5-dehydrogenase [Chelatococcus composti]
MTPSIFDLSGRTALVTGAGQGIGLAIARGLAAAGARVVLNGRDTAKLERAAALIREAGGEADMMPFDVTDAAAVREGVARIEREIGPLTILVNNAGIQHRAPLEDFADEDWHRIIRTNLDSVYYVGQTVARHMIPRGYGKIINICSVISELARPTIAPYAASKGAVKMLTKGMAADWGRHGIRVNGIGPGFFATEMNAALVANADFSAWLVKRTPLGRWGEVDELVGAAIFLSAPASDFVTGHVLYVDGGVTASL